MFSPVVNANLDELLDSLGSFYKNLDEDSVGRIKIFWTAMIESVGALYYDLYQNSLAKLLNYTQGYIENIGKEYKIIFAGDLCNVTNISYSAPVLFDIGNSSPSLDNVIYTYAVSSVTPYGETLCSTELSMGNGASDLSGNNNYLTWYLVSGIDSYNIYGRTSEEFVLLESLTGVTYVNEGTYTYYDDGSNSGTIAPPEENTAIWSRVYKLPETNYYMSIPTLSGEHTGQILYENIDYEIEDLNKIKFLKPLSSVVSGDYISYNSENYGYETAETFIARQEICLLPNLVSIYWPGIGISSPEAITNSNIYFPPLRDIESESYFNQRVAYAQHLTYWTYGFINIIRDHPTMANIKKAYGYLMGVPFNYFDGEVISIDNDANYNYITISGDTGQYEYQAPASLVFNFEVGDDVNRFDLLADGAYVTDYITDFPTVSGNTLKAGQIKNYNLFLMTLSTNHTTYNLSENTGEDVFSALVGNSTIKGF